jgi:hypothetical protein
MVWSYHIPDRVGDDLVGRWSRGYVLGAMINDQGSSVRSEVKAVCFVVQLANNLGSDSGYFIYCLLAHDYVTGCP